MPAFSKDGGTDSHPLIPAHAGIQGHLLGVLKLLLWIPA
jgi:hypothetical protein